MFSSCFHDNQLNSTTSARAPQVYHKCTTARATSEPQVHHKTRPEVHHKCTTSGPERSRDQSKRPRTPHKCTRSAPQVSHNRPRCPKSAPQLPHNCATTPPHKCTTSAPQVRHRLWYTCGALVVFFEAHLWCTCGAPTGICLHLHCLKISYLVVKFG